MEIKNIEQLITPLTANGKKFLSYEQTKLLSPGENYGSTMLQLKLHFRNEDKADGESSSSYECVAKLVPPTEFIWTMFNTPVTFKKEIGVYKDIVPTLRKFGAENGIGDLLPFFADYIGSRISLDPSSAEVDKDAALLLNNLKHDGYGLVDRFDGFDRETILLLLKDLATLHASTIAFKLAKPDEFRRKVKCHLYKGFTMKFSDDSMNQFNTTLSSYLKKDPKCAHLIEKISRKMFDERDFFIKPRVVREPFATFTHNDLWTNNVMVKFAGDGRSPISCKFVDFQTIDYGNPADDVIFLLYSSVRFELLPQIDEFIEHYHKRFVEVLKELNCDTGPFSFENFAKEIDAAVRDTEFLHILFMLQPIFTKKGEAKELNDMKGEDDMMVANDSLHENYFRRLCFFVDDFERRGWIK